MTSRYDKRLIRTNFTKKYSDIFIKRNIGFVEQYMSPRQEEISSDDISGLTIVTHLWSVGDRFYKLADEAYSDPSLWWVIAWFNRMPTEAHVKIGWIINVPTPLEKVLQLWDR